jgi:PhnB protein
MAACSLPEEQAMGSQLNPYISFDGDARQAIEFYQAVFGGELNLNTFGQYGQGGEIADKIMHGQLTTPSGYTLMAADTPPGMDYNPGTNITVSLSGDDEAELRGYWEKLIDGGTVSVPLEKQMWGDVFGSCQDKFGIYWLVNIAG